MKELVEKITNKSLIKAQSLDIIRGQMHSAGNESRSCFILLQRPLLLRICQNVSFVSVKFLETLLYIYFY